MDTGKEVDYNQSVIDVLIVDKNNELWHDIIVWKFNFFGNKANTFKLMGSKNALMSKGVRYETDI